MADDAMKGADIASRLLEFGVRSIKVASSLPKSFIGKHIALQLLRCATSAGANYEEARGSQTLPEFVHKPAIAWREIRESAYWLKLIRSAKLINPSRLDDLIQEANELSAILGKSVVTAKKRQKAKDHHPPNENWFFASFSG